MSQISIDSDGQKVVDFVKVKANDKLYDFMLQVLIENFKGFKVDAIFDDAYGHNVIMDDVRIKIRAKSKKNKDIKIDFRHRDIMDNKNLFDPDNYVKNFKPNIVDSIISGFIKDNIEKYYNKFNLEEGYTDTALVHVELVKFVNNNYGTALSELVKKSEFFIKLNDELLILVKEYINQDEFNEELKIYLNTYMNEYMGKIVSASSRFGLSLEDLKNKITAIYISEIQNS